MFLIEQCIMRDIIAVWRWRATNRRTAAWTAPFGEARRTAGKVIHATYPGKVVPRQNMEAFDLHNPGNVVPRQNMKAFDLHNLILALERGLKGPPHIFRE